MGRFNSGNGEKPELEKSKITKKALKHALILATYVKPYKVKFFMGMIFLLGSSLTFLALPKELGNMINAATNSLIDKSAGNIKEIGLVLFLLLCVQALFSYLRIIWFVEVAEKSLAELRKDTYAKLITMPMYFFTKRRVGELNSRISTDLSQIQDTLTTILPELLRQVIMLSGGIVMLSLVSIKLMLLILCTVPFLVLFAVVFGRFIRKLARSAQDKLGDSNTVVEETLQGIVNVKAFVCERLELSRYGKSIDEVVNLVLKGARYRGAFVVFVTLGLFGSIIGVSAYGVYLVSIQKIAMGDLISFVLYAGFVGGSMGGFAEFYSQLQKTIGSTERVIEILHEKNEPILLHEQSNQALHSLKGRISFENVTFAYPGRLETPVLNGLSFTVNQGEKIAVVGPSGAGKSTIVSLLLRFYETGSGSILFDDKPANAYSLSDIRRQIGIVPQDVMLFGSSIKENIAYGKVGAANEEIIEAAKRANAHEFIMKFPGQYETPVGERGIKLSGGQRQRIAIARAILKDPVILILDEATSSLDSESERLVQQALDDLMQNRTSIIIAHRLSTVRKADKIIVLDRGKIVEQGSHQDLLKKEKGLYKYYTSLQPVNQQEGGS